MVPEERDLNQHIYDLESRLLEPAVRASRVALERLLDEDFLEFGSSGRTFDREQTVQALQEPTDLRYSLSDFRAQRLGSDAVLATYRATARDGESRRESLRSSVWTRRRGSWRLLFHQGTLVAREEPLD